MDGAFHLVCPAFAGPAAESGEDYSRGVGGAARHRRKFPPRGDGENSLALLQARPIARSPRAARRRQRKAGSFVDSLR